MNEFIKKLIEKIRKSESVKIFGSVNSDNRLIPVSEVEKIINQFAGEYNNGWIPCSVRLPEYNDKDYFYTQVIVQLKDGRVGTGCYRNKDNEWWGDFLNVGYRNITDEVIAWQPLPEPYQTEECQVSDQWKQQTMNRFEKVE